MAVARMDFQRQWGGGGGGEGTGKEAMKMLTESWQERELERNGHWKSERSCSFSSHSE